MQGGATQPNRRSSTPPAQSQTLEMTNSAPSLAPTTGATTVRDSTQHNSSAISSSSNNSTVGLAPTQGPGLRTSKRRGRPPATPNSRPAADPGQQHQQHLPSTTNDVRAESESQPVASSLTHNQPMMLRQRRCQGQPPGDLLIP